MKNVLKVEKVDNRKIRLVEEEASYLVIDEAYNETVFPYHLYKVQVKLPMFNIWITIKEFDYGYKPEDEIFAKNEAECLLQYIVNPYHINTLYNKSNGKI